MGDQESKQPQRPAPGQITSATSRKVQKSYRRRQRCRATARTTGRQCSKRAMWGVDYCRLHYPWKGKRPSLVVGAFIGVILSLGLQFVWHAFMTSRAEATITRGDELARSLYSGSAQQQALTSMVYRNVGLACETWINAYRVLSPDRSEAADSSDGGAGAMLDGAAAPDFSVEAWERFHPLFDDVIDRCASQLDDVMAMHGALLPPDFRTLVTETKQSFELVRRTYRFARVMSDAANRKPAFAYPFREMSRAVARLAHECDRRRAEARLKVD